MDGVVNVLPVPSDVPPVGAAYQLITFPAPVLAFKITVPVPQVEPAAPGVAFDGMAFTSAVTATRAVDRHPVVVFLVSA